MTSSDRRTLRDRAYTPLPVGSIEPRGWLRRQLRIQADGLTGTLDEFWADLADNQWLGGENDGWERGPYYADGLVPLAYLLGDDGLRAKADTWAEAFLDSQDESGWIGPNAQASDQGYDYDPWPRFVVLKVLRQHYEATGEERVLDAMTAFCRYLSHALDNKPLEEWGEYRWADLVVTVHWLYERTGDDWLLGLAETAAAQGYDWTGHFEKLWGYQRPQPTDDIEMASHVVNNAMGIKAPAVWYRQSRAEADREGVANALDNLDTFHGQATGLFTGDEHFGGKDPTRGTELCAVVEYLYSLEEAISVHGDVALADRLERIAYNALPATFTPDMWAHQYDQQANQVVCNVADREWSNGPDANVFGLLPNFGCCLANMHQGWPKFAQHLWMGADDGLAAVAYGPSEVTTEIEGEPVTVVEETAYPFGDTVTMTVETAGAASFPLELRIPGWAEGATVTLPDGETANPSPGAFHTVERTWGDGDTVEVTFECTVEAERRYQGAVALSRGPLVFSLPVEADWKQISGTEPAADWELYPAEPWNYGLDVDADAPESSVDRSVGSPGERPFSPEDAPVELAVEGRRVPGWTLDGNDAGDVPSSPVVADEPIRELTLVPYGCTNLRVTELPLLAE